VVEDECVMSIQPIASPVARSSSSSAGACNQEASRDAGQQRDKRGPSGVPFADKELRQIHRDLYGGEPFYGEEQHLRRDDLPMILQRALDGERKRGAAGHWSYSRNRHVNLAKWVQRCG